MGYDDYISNIGGKFSVDRVFNDKKYNFGVFNSYEDALDKIDYLEEEGWPISVNIGENELVDEFGRVLTNIEKYDDNFIVFKFIDGEKVIFGEFESLDEAVSIRDNLIDNAWESMEPNDRSKYGKYIQKSHNKFVVVRVYNGVYHNFGYFDSFEEALECRENLVATNWGDLNIAHKMRYGKYIAYNGIMYTVSKTLDNGSLNIFGFFDTLEGAVKQRDWLVENNWSRLEVPDDSKKYIHKNGDKFLIYKKIDDELEYFGTYSSFEEAKYMRNKLIENDWDIPDESDIEWLSDFLCYDGEFYIIEKEVDENIRIYGVYKNKKQAISYEEFLINNDWDAPYAISTNEYPYGESIVPFDYIFILEDPNFKKEIGHYYSFKEALLAKNDLLNDDFDEGDRLTFSVKIGKSYKNKGWSIIRDTTYDLFPKLPYEEECGIIVDGIPTKGKLNLLPRIFYSKDDNVINHLKELADENPNGRINVELLLNKDHVDPQLQIDELNSKISDLTNVIDELKQYIGELEKIIDGDDEH